MGVLMASIERDRIEDLGLLDRLQEKSHGAIVSFEGVVRNHNLGRRVCSVEYDCFVPLAEKELQKIASLALERWGDLYIVVAHRIGELRVGDCSVAIGVSSVHRSETFEACRFVIESIKHNLPIWKKETYEDGTSDWVSGHSLCSH